MLIRALKDFFIFGFATYGVLWTVAESFGAFFDNLKPEGLYWYLSIIACSVLVGLWKAWPRATITIEVPNSDSSIVITFGDIFKDSHAIVIPVNEFFDGNLGDHVSENSLHGKFIKNVLGGQSATFNQLTEKTLKNIQSESVSRASGRKNKYPIGTTAIVDVNNVRYFLTALSITDINTLKASATIHELWNALEGIWEAIHNHSNGYIVKIPLLGSGLSGVGLPSQRVIDQILTSFFYYTKKHKISDKVTLMLTSDMKSEIDLLSIKRRWQ